MKTAQQALDSLIDYMNGFKYKSSSWYAGVAANPRDRLFKDHNVAEESVWAYELCATHSDARAIEKALLGLGCKGGSGGGDNLTKSCYVYLITPTTRE